MTLTATIVRHIDLSDINSKKQQEIKEKQKDFDQRVAVDFCKKADRLRSSNDVLGAIKACNDALKSNPDCLRANDILGEIIVDSALNVGLSDTTFKNMVGAVPKALRISMMRAAEQAVQKKEAKELAHAHQSPEARKVIDDCRLKGPLNPAFANAFDRLTNDEQKKIHDMVEDGTIKKTKRSNAAKKAAATRKAKAKQVG
jgi:hypothetical protein